MSRHRPHLALTVDGQELTAAEAAAALVLVDLGFGPAHDRCRLALHPLSPLAAIAPQAEVVVELGAAGPGETVFTGRVDQVSRGPAGIEVEAFAPSMACARTRVAQAYRDQSAADIATDLLQRCGVDVGTLDAPTAFAAFHVDERQSVWRHLLRLAALAGGELASDADGAVCLRPPAGGPAALTLRQGAELLDQRLTARAPGEAGWDAAPHGAASEEGAAKWHLLLREPDGGSPSAPVLIPPSLRDRDGADALAQALAATATRRTAGGAALVMGDPRLRPGQVVELDGVDGGGEARVLAVSHRLDGRGFATRLRLGGLA